MIITLHGGFYQNTMNVDIIMSAKDFGKTEGLCGNFDGNPSNDFVRSDGGTSNNNADYAFSESWRYMHLHLYHRRLCGRVIRNAPNDFFRGYERHNKHCLSVF